MILTILAFAYVVLATVFVSLIGIAAMVFYLLGLRKLAKQIIYWVERFWSMSIIKVVGFKVTVTGREKIPKEGGVCFVSNHSGYFDIVLLLAYCGRLIGFIAKKELAYVPLLNIWIYMIGGLFIDRKSVKKASRTINKGVEKIKSGGCMIVFPEGHRSKDGALLPFHPGSLKLATMAEAPIVPVVLQGSYEVFEKNRRVVRHPVKVTFCDPIETAGLPPTDKKVVLCDRIYSVMKEQMGV